MKGLLLCLVLLASSAFAEDFNYARRWGIGASAGYNTPVFGNIFNNAADGGETWGAHVRYHLCDSCGLEAAFTKHEFKDTKSALQVTDLTFFKRLRPLERLTPVIGAGLGVVDISNYDPNSLKLGVKLRAGAEYALNQAFSLGLNLDYQHVNKMIMGDNLPVRNIHALAARVGLTWYFGSPKSEKAPVAAAAAPVAQKVVQDGDSDADGVADSADKCPTSAPGTKVNAYGCAEAEKATVALNVQFDTGKATIASGYEENLKEIAAFMSEHPSTKIEIQGHTDSSGSKALNEKLSQARAEAVRNHLVNDLKADGSRITAKGFGPAMPVADNTTVEGRQKNRRVIAVINE